MQRFSDKLRLFREIVKNPQILKAPLPVLIFLKKYMDKFTIVNAGGNFIIHSHLPPINSRAYSRFINEHLLADSWGPAHAQIAITNACPQNCVYCYNKKRTGTPLTTDEILKTVQELKAMGVFWLGLTGGEPLLNKDIVKIVESAADSCAVKLFTTGCTLTEELARDLKKAGLFSVAVSLDSSRPDEHDQIRNYKGAYAEAVRAIDIFKSTGLHVSVSAVISKNMINSGQTEDFLVFLEGLGIHEAWLSEMKPSVDEHWSGEHVITAGERDSLIRLQDRRNKQGKMTVNYLGSFESKEHFGCNAGFKMIYVDAFGEVSPCVFIPMTFGNIREKRVSEIWKEMRSRFSSEDSCFMNKNHGLLKKYYRGKTPIPQADSLKIMQEAGFGAIPEFTRLTRRQ